MVSVFFPSFFCPAKANLKGCHSRSTLEANSLICHTSIAALSVFFTHTHRHTCLAGILAFVWRWWFSFMSLKFSQSFGKYICLPSYPDQYQFPPLCSLTCTGFKCITDHIQVYKSKPAMCLLYQVFFLFLFRFDIDHFCSCTCLFSFSFLALLLSVFPTFFSIWFCLLQPASVMVMQVCVRC